MALHTELPIYRAGVQLLQLAVDVQVQLPRTVKRHLGEKISAHCMEMLDRMALANATKQAERAAHIEQLLAHPADLGRLLLDCAIVQNVATDQWSYQHMKPEALLLAARHYGVDIEAARASVQTPAPESDATEAAPKGKAKKGKKAETQPELV